MIDCLNIMYTFVIACSKLVIKGPKSSNNYDLLHEIDKVSSDYSRSLE